MNLPSDDKLNALRDLIANGRKIEAIKLYREATNVGLKEAKDIVEAMEESIRSGVPISFPINTTPPPASMASPDDQLAQLHGMIFAGQKIDAIKLYREASGVGLKEAKDAVELMEANLRREQPHRFQTVQGKGCGAGMLLFCLCLGSVLCWVVSG